MLVAELETVIHTNTYLPSTNSQVDKKGSSTSFTIAEPLKKIIQKFNNSNI